MKRLLFICLALLVGFGATPPSGRAEEAGVPLIRSFSLREAGATQVVDIAQGPRGLLYFGDYNVGLIEHDGEHWRSYDLPDSAVAVEEDADGRLWVAGPGNLGYMKADAAGRLEYVSLLDRLPPEQRGFSNVWPVMPTSRGVFFMAREFLFRYRDGELTAWPGTVDEVFYRGYEIDGRLFFAQLGVGLLELVDERLVPIAEDQLAGSTEVNAVFSRGDGSMWVITRLRGVYVYHFGRNELEPVVTPVSQWLIDSQVQHACALPDGRLAIASRRGGVAIVDRDLRLLKVLDESTGLSSTKVSYVKTDYQGNLWAVGDGGIDRVILDTSVVLFGPEAGLESGVHAVIRHQDRLLVATDLGLAVGEPSPDGRLSFSRVPDLPTATWSMISDDDVVLAATTDGVFEVRLSTGPGVALSLVRRLSYDATQDIFQPSTFDDHVLVALDNGLGLLERQGRSWVMKGRVPGVEHRIYDFLEGDDGEILGWAATAGRLLILRFENGPEAAPEVRVVELEGYGPTRLGDEIVRHDGEGWVRYLGPDAPGGELFGPASELEAFSSYDLVLEDASGRRWIYGAQGVGLARPSDDGGIRFQPLAARPIDGFVNVYEDPELEDTFWVGTDHGLYRWSGEAVATSRDPAATLIRRVSLLQEDRELYFGGGRLDRLPVLPYEQGSLRFELAAPIYDQQMPVLYQTRLDGFDTEWSPWSEETFKEYTNLWEGSYTFRARALDSWGQTSREAVFGFEISAPWYRTPWSYFGAFVLAVGLVLLGLRLRTSSELRERRRLEAVVREHTRELEHGKRQVERQAKALGAANRRLAEENEHRRVLEAEREKLQVRMEQNQKLESLGLVAGGVAHDFNNILMAILGNADLALEDSGRDPTVLRGRLQEIRRASHRAAELCRHMLTYAGKGPVQKTEIDLTTVALESLEIIRAGGTADVGFEIEVLENPPAIEADGTQLRQVVMNLLLNAVESFDGLAPRSAGEADSSGEKQTLVRLVTGRRHLDPSFFQETFLADPLPGGTYVFLRVEDNGSGMDEATIKKIFDPFFTTKFTGRGLGLAATLGMVRNSSGAIRVESEPGEGTAIEIFFPALDHQVDPSSKGSSSDALRGWHQTGTVLVVDDEQIVRDVVSVMLHNTGFDVLLAASGEEALEVYEREHENLAAVIMDLSMPDLDGREVFRRMGEIEARVPVILSSGYTGDEITERYLEEGFAGFLHKPYRSDSLRETLKRILER